MNKKRFYFIALFTLLFALLLYFSFAVTPADIVLRRSDAAVVQLAAFNGTSPGYFGGNIKLIDINNDENMDLIVCAFIKNISGGAKDNTGQISIFYGSSDGLHSSTASEANVTINATAPGLLCYNSLLVEDVNNDSYKDLIAGAYGRNINGGAMDYTGQVYVFYGGSGGLYSCTTEEANVTLNGTSPSSFGFGLAAADLNNDGFKDLAVGATGKNLSGGSRDYVGQVNIFYGSSGGLHSYTAAEANVTINGTSPGAFGYSIIADDLNNDSYNDLLVSARLKNLSGGAYDETGQVHIFYGGAGGFYSSTADEANVTFNGSAIQDYLGEYLYTGYVNNDSYKDIIINARSARSDPVDANTNMGMLLIFYGSSGGFRSYTRQQANVTLNGSSSDGNHFGAVFIVDDFNNDSYKDILTSARQQNLSFGNHDQTGQAYIFYGVSGGFYSNAAENANFTLNGSLKNYYFGYSVDSANSTYSHRMFAVGAWGENLSGGTADNWGRVYIYSLNFPPSFSAILNQTWNQDANLTLNLSQYFSDVNQDNPNWTWNNVSNITISIDEAANVATLAPDAGWFGSGYIVFSANDSYNLPVDSNNVTLTVNETTPPGTIGLNLPVSGFNTSSANVVFNWTAFDNAALNLSCNITIGGYFNQTNITANGSTTETTVRGLADGAHLWNITCYDEAGNKNTSETRSFTVDTVKPHTLALDSVANGLNTTSTSLNFNWTATDATSSVVTCDLVIDSVINKSFTHSSGVLKDSGTIAGFAEGTHYWNVTCNDTAGNLNATGSETRHFTVDLTNPVPTLSLSSTSILLRATETITCTATDRGAANPASFTVKLPNGDYSSDRDGTFTDTSIIGTYTVTCSATDNVGNSASTTAAFTAGSEITNAATGGSGGATAAPTPVVSTTLSTIAPEAPAVVKIDNAKIAVNEIKLEVNEEASNVKVSVTAITAPPSGTSAPAGGVYKYLDIKKENLADENLKSAKVSFFVERTWLAENGVVPANVALKRFAEAWEELPTKVVTSDEDKFYFEAETPGFSLFAITAKKAVKEAAEEESEEITKEPVKGIVAEPVIAEKQSNAWLYAILIVVIALIAGAFFLFGFKRKRNRHRQRKHKR